MSRNARRALVGVVGAIIALNVLVAIVEGALGGTPGGPRSSSYATGTDGLAAYEALLTRIGHPVVRERRPAADADLDAGSSAILLDPGFVDSDDVAALRRFVQSGGRLVAGDGATGWIERLVGTGPLGLEEARIARPRVLAPAPEVTGIERLATDGGAFTTPRGTLPLYGGAEGAVVAVSDVGRGRVVLLADTSLLDNGHLARLDNAGLGVAAVGAPSRTVVFLESYHGYGPAEGLSALPDRWWSVLAGLLTAGAVFLWARFRRLGPPERESRDLAPARLEYVRALADLLDRRGADATAARLLRERANAHLERHLGPSPDGLTPERLARHGIAAEPAAALTAPPANLIDVAAAAAAVERRARRIE